MVVFKFAKRGDMIFYSHLDLVRQFSLAIKRADMGVHFDKDGNPKMTFSPPTSTGVESECEYVEIDANVSPHKLAGVLETYLPEGVVITGEYYSKKKVNIAKIAKLARYEVTIDNLQGVQKRLLETLNDEEFVVKSKMNNVVRMTKAKNYIHKVSVEQDKLAVYALVGNKNISVRQFVGQALTKIGEESHNLSVKKTNLFAIVDGRFHDVELLLIRSSSK